MPAPPAYRSARDAHSHGMPANRYYVDPAAIISTMRELEMKVQSLKETILRQTSPVGVSFWSTIRQFFPLQNFPTYESNDLIVAIEEQIL